MPPKPEINAPVSAPAPETELHKEVAEAIKTRFVKPDLTVGKAHLLNPSTHNGIDYTAGGQLAPRWVENKEGAIGQKLTKGFVFPETISPRLKNLTVGNLVLMVRPTAFQEQHQANVEAANRKWEADTKAKTGKRDKAPGLGEFDITPSQRTRS